MAYAFTRGQRPAIWRCCNQKIKAIASRCGVKNFFEFFTIFCFEQNAEQTFGFRNLGNSYSSLTFQLP